MGRRADPAARVGIFSELVRSARIAWRLLLDPRVPLHLKLLIPLAAAYVAWPVDIVPDLLVGAMGIGIADDLAVIVIAVRLLIGLAPKHVVQQHLDELSGAPRSNVHDASYRVVED
jgi:uncharacterized membrane protein YkvA (DUF1232 family)